MAGRRVAVTVLVLGLAACGGEPDPSGERAAFEPLPEWRIEEIVRIGSLDDPEQALGPVRNIRIDPGGAIYVAEGVNEQIRVYDQDGALLRTIGRKGQGPGEFGSLIGIGFLGDTLYGADQAQGRTSLFALDGTLLSTTDWPTIIERLSTPGLGIFITAPQIVRADGSGIASRGMSEPYRPEEGGPQYPVAVQAVYRMEPGSPEPDTVVLVHSEGAVNSVSVGGGEIQTVWCSLRWRHIVEPRADGEGAVLVDRPDKATTAPAFRVTFVAPSGDTTAVRNVPYEPVPTEGPVLDEYVAGVRSRARERGDPEPTSSDIEAALREIDCLPETAPPVLAVVSGQDGTVWIMMSGLPEDPTTWQVLDEDGRPIGRVRIPRPAVVSTARGDLLVTREIDELGIPYITLYRIVR